MKEDFLPLTVLIEIDSMLSDKFLKLILKSIES